VQSGTFVEKFGKNQGNLLGSGKKKGGNCSEMAEIGGVFVVYFTLLFEFCIL
jgi:hypothetical protein